MTDVVLFLRTGHGWLGVLTVALLLHPVLGRPRAPGGRAPWSLLAAVGFLVAAFASGWLLYPGYREDPKPALLRVAPDLARAFETKEHLAWYVLVLGACGAFLVARGADGAAARSGRFMLGAAAVIGAAVCLLGATVASWRPPG